MNESEPVIRHLLDLCRKADRAGCWCYSSFLSLAEQNDFIRSPEASSYSWTFYGGWEAAERKILIAGDEDTVFSPPSPPVSGIQVTVNSRKFAEDLTHRDYLGALMNLGIERSMLGDLLVKDAEARLICMDSVQDYIISSLTTVRRTAVTAEPMPLDDPSLAPEVQPFQINIASERLDAIVAEFANASRTSASAFFPAGKVFVNGQAVLDRNFRLRQGDILSVRGVGKARYEGILRETRKGRYVALLQKYV